MNLFKIVETISLKMETSHSLSRISVRTTTRVMELVQVYEKQSGYQQKSIKLNFNSQILRFVFILIECIFCPIFRIIDDIILYSLV